MSSPLSHDIDEDVFLSSQTCSTTSRVKVINDPIHGHFEIPPHVLSVTDTPHVQRLRDLKQLGGTYLVYPGSSHNRFEHSLGVSHLSGQFVTTLYNNQRDLDAHSHYDSERHMKTASSLVEIAGLVHDLGHGPFSHMFDHDFLPAVKCKGHVPEGMMHHEDRSVNLFEHCVNTYNLDVEKEHVGIIGDLIKGVSRKNCSVAPEFLFQIVSNNLTGIDTDKFDYLARDVYNVGLQGAYGFDHKRLIRFAKVIGNNVCFHRKELFNVYHLFLTRFQLHRTVYNHRASLSIDAMLTDAFLHADSTLKISESTSNPEDFLHMTDSLVAIIERSKEPELKQSRHIIHRLRRRKLYRYVDEHLMPTNRSISISPQDITTCQDTAHSGIILSPEDIHVKMVTLDFGMKEHNPVDKVLFFKNWEDVNPMYIWSKKASYVMPAQFQENILRVYMKREASNEEEERRLKRALRIAFHNYLRRHSLSDSDEDNGKQNGFHDLESASKKRTRHNVKVTGVVPFDWLVNGNNSKDGIVESADSRLAKRDRPTFGPI